jgi:hypothetical protein
MRASHLLWLALLAWCSVSESQGEKVTKIKEDGSSSSVKASNAAPEQELSPSLTDAQRQMLVDNRNRRMEKIRRIERKLEGLRQMYPRANMFAIVQEQLDEIKAQLDIDSV